MNVVSLRLMLVYTGLTKTIIFVLDTFKYCPSGFQLSLGAKSLLNVLYRPDSSFLLGSKSQAKF
jgi:hypothetical protein